MTYKSLLSLAAAQAVSAHFGLVYPEWRADSLANEETYSQYSYPCADVEYGAGNTTDWPLEGGSLKLDLHHPWSYVYVNLAMGSNSSNFNVSLTPQLWNVTGKGTLCVDKMPVPVDVQDGDMASIQVVTSGESGNALYNCADIRFKKDAKALDNCTTSDGLVVNKIKDQTGNSTSDSDEDSASGNDTDSSRDDSDSADSPDDEGAAGAFRVDKVALATAAGLATAFALGLGV